MFSQLVFKQAASSQHHVNVCYVTAVVLLWIASLVYAFLIVSSLVDIGILDFRLQDGPFDPIPGNQFNAPPWVFYIIWSIISLYQAAFLFYMISVLTRKSKVTGQPLYLVADFIPVHVIFLYIINLVLLIIWLFVSGEDNRIGSLVVLYIDVIILACVYGFAIRAIYKRYPQLNAAGFKREDILVVGIFINGIGVLLNWVFVATNVNLVSVLQEEVELNKDISAATPLTLLIVGYVVYVFLDIGFLEKYFRFLYAPHLPFVFGLISIVSSDEFEPDRSLSPILIGFTIVVLVVVPIKICLDYTRERNRPRFGNARLRYEGLQASKVAHVGHVGHVNHVGQTIVIS